MKIQTYNYPKSSFLSLEKDMEIITSQILKNDRLKKLLYYTTRDCMDKPNLTEEESISLMGKNIKMVPKLYVDSTVENYIVVSFDNFITNPTNPEFRNNIIKFDIICHADQWMLKDFQMRPYRIAAELDTIFDHKHLTGIGDLYFLGANQTVMTNEYSGICVMYQTIHGEEDKKFMLNPSEQLQFEADFNKMFNEQ